MIDPPICIECQMRQHDHDGKCGKPAVMIIPTAAGGIDLRRTCTCKVARPLGVVDADTQMEVALR